MVMSDQNQQRDPFKPEQPRIPGVPGPQERSVKTIKVPKSIKLRVPELGMPPRWLLLTIMAAVAAGIAVAWWTR
jgi:hypothetical protein